MIEQRKTKNILNLKNDKKRNPHRRTDGALESVDTGRCCGTCIRGVQHTFTFDFDFTREHVLSDAKNIYLSKNIYFELSPIFALLSFYISTGLSNETKKSEP